MKKLFFIFLLLVTGVAAFSQNNFDPKTLLTPPTGKQQLVNDYSNVLTPDQKQTLESKLDIFDDSTSNQIALVIIPSLGDFDISDYSVKLGRAWGVGGKQFNNGVVMIICTDPGNHKLFIATGYGLEGALPDVTCKEIIDDIITPDFRAGDYYRGINEGTDAIIQATKGEYKAPEGYGQNGGGISVVKIFFLIIIIVIILSIISRGGGGGFLGGFLLGNVLGGGGSGWSGGSSGGGGFGGFGGGSFGGGGAGGSW